MSAVVPGRFTAQTDKPVVLFLIGMRINHLHKVSKWWPVATAMPRMLAELEKRPEAGMLWYRSYISGRVIFVQQYWKSIDQLIDYAHAKDQSHFPAWAAFNKAVGSDGTVGIWHETYFVTPGSFECVYGNMPTFGLAAATSSVPATGRLAAARSRFGTEVLTK